MAALAQYIQREGRAVVPRGHTEHLALDEHGTDASAGEGSTVAVKLGVWLSNQKSRRDRLTEQQLAQLADLGLDWAA